MNGRQTLSVFSRVTSLSAVLAAMACGSPQQAEQASGPASIPTVLPGTAGTPATAAVTGGHAASLTGAAATGVAGNAAIVTSPPVATAGTAGTPPSVVAGAGGAAAGSGGSVAAGAGGAGGEPGTRAIGSPLYDATTGVLSPPATGDGVQVTTTAFDLQPGEEKFTCYHGEIPLDGEIDVHYYESKMSPGSHHFILYKSASDPSAVGTMDQHGCLTDFTNWIYSSAQPHIDLKIPDGVAMVLSARQRVLFDMHYINTTDKVLHVSVALNVVTAKGSFQKAAPLISYNTGIALPPHGMQTVGGDCIPGSGAKFFYMLTHTHRRGQLATITRVKADGTMGENIITSTNWDVPQDKDWVDSPYLTFAAGEKFHYSCSYMNDLNQTVTAGPSANTNEMCMAITYYFPASAGGSCR